MLPYETSQDRCVVMTHVPFLSNPHFKLLPPSVYTEAEQEGAETLYLF